MNWTCLVVAIGASAALAAGQTQRVSVDSAGAQANTGSTQSALSFDGRYVVFRSYATNLVPGDTNGAWDIFLHDRQSGLTSRVSVDSGGAQSNGMSVAPALSADGRMLVFQSYATNLVPGDTNVAADVFVRDLQTGLTTRASVDSAGAEGNGTCTPASLSADGRCVAFVSTSSNLVPGDTNQERDVFVRDLVAGQTLRVSVDSAGMQGNLESGSYDGWTSLSADGRFVAFESSATNLVAFDTNIRIDIFVRDRQNGTTERVSLASGGAQGNGHSRYPSISADGRFVTFQSSATNLVAGDTNAAEDIFVHDRVTGATTRVSVDSAGVQGTQISWRPSISADGRLVVFNSDATNLVAGDTNAWPDVFVHDSLTGQTQRVSVDSAGAQANGPTGGWATISGDGRLTTFGSSATNLVPGDTNTDTDVFVHEAGIAGFAELCEPGTGGVIACPCANPPAGAGRGCDNSAATGGASLTGSGWPSIAQDSVAFTTTGELPSATSILLQGNTAVASGLIFGQGVRCTGGALKRLFTKSASAGSIVAPDFAAGDPSLSARSAALGDAIQAGQSRWYAVYYRDPNVLGGCSALATYNVTQSERVDWYP